MAMVVESLVRDSAIDYTLPVCGELGNGSEWVIVVTCSAATLAGDRSPLSVDHKAYP